MSYNICKCNAYNFIWLTNVIIDNNYELLLLLLQYSVYYAGDGLDYSSVYWTSASLCKATLQQGTGCTVHDLRPYPLPRRGWSLSVSCGSVYSSPCSEHSALRLALVWLDVFLPTCDTKYWTETFGPWDGGRELDISTDLHGQTSLQGAHSISQPTCLYYIVLTKSLCLTIPFLYSNGETLLVYVFDICTNAPLWKKKMKLWHIWNKWATCVFLLGSQTEGHAPLGAIAMMDTFLNAQAMKSQQKSTSWSAAGNIQRWEIKMRHILLQFLLSNVDLL